METKVRARPNHYEVLGIAPTAAGDEIARAFARESSIFRPHSFGGVAELCIAYETLRDPGKRRAYDDSLGLQIAPPPPQPRLDAKPGKAAFFHPVLGSLKGPNRREPGSPAPNRSPAPVPDRLLRHRPEPDPKSLLDAQLGAGVSPIDWKRTGVAAGAVVIGACLLGGLAGWWSATDIRVPQPPANTASFELPPAEPLPIAVAPPPAQASGSIKARDFPQRPAAIVAARPERPPAARQKSVAADQASPIQPPPGGPEQNKLDTNGTELASAAPLAAGVAAAMPLPNRVVAQTIDRIGYSCGEVSATRPVEGQGTGVYKVTCTSGQSFQARPVNGRYRFRRLGRR